MMSRAIRTGRGWKCRDCEIHGNFLNGADSEFKAHCINVFEFESQVDEVFQLLPHMDGPCWFCNYYFPVI